MIEKLVQVRQEKSFGLTRSDEKKSTHSEKMNQLTVCAKKDQLVKTASIVFPVVRFSLFVNINSENGVTNQVLVLYKKIL